MKPVIEFGRGVVLVSVGNYGGKPAILISPVQDEPGNVGDAPSDLEPDRGPHLRDGQQVMTFPTMRQAKAVARALWNECV